MIHPSFTYSLPKDAPYHSAFYGAFWAACCDDDFTVSFPLTYSLTENVPYHSALNGAFAVIKSETNARPHCKMQSSPRSRLVSNANIQKNAKHGGLECHQLKLPWNVRLFILSQYCKRSWTMASPAELVADSETFLRLGRFMYYPTDLRRLTRINKKAGINYFWEDLELNGANFKMRTILERRKRQDGKI